MRIFLMLCFFALSCGRSAGQNADFRVIAYYSGSADKLDQYDVSGLTHIIHCFSHLKGNHLNLGGSGSVRTLKKMVSLKKRHPNLQVLLSLGGWTGCYTCSDVFSAEKNRIAFARSVKRALERYHADGIDLDWEYPAVEGPPGHPYKPEDRENFTDLIVQLRKELGQKYSISFAAGGFDTYFEHAVEWKQVGELVDFINLMSYDLVNGYSKVTGHHTPLYSTTQNPFSVDYGVSQMLTRGVPADKIVIGMAFYGRVWEHVPDVDQGLYQPGKFKRSISIKSIDKIAEAHADEVYWDSIAQAPYIYNPVTRLFYTYDDKRSVRLKTRYALDKHLGGAMFWQLGLDYTRNGLLATIIEEVNGRAFTSETEELPDAHAGIDR